MKFAYEALPGSSSPVYVMEGPPWISDEYTLRPDDEGSDVILSLVSTSARMEAGFDWKEWDTLVARVEALRVGKNPNVVAFIPPSLFEGTQQLMEAGGQLDEIGFPPDFDHKDREFRRGLLASEYLEYLDDGEGVNDPVETADGLLDIIVVAWGSLLKYFGHDKAKRMADEVVRSNLDKINGKHGPVVKRGDGKIMKPEGWVPPQISAIIYESEEPK